MGIQNEETKNFTIIVKVAKRADLNSLSEGVNVAEKSIG